MTLSKLEKEVKRLEALGVSSASGGAKYKALEDKFDADTAEKLSKAFSDPQKMTEFAEAMPESPDLSTVLAAFPDPAKLGAFVDGALAGKASVFAVLAEQGCGRDPKKLAELAEAVAADPAPFKNLLSEGGMAAQPEALAAILETGCGGDVTKFKELMAKFPDTEARTNLANALGSGGLGHAPHALAALVAADGGTFLKRLTADITDPDDLEKLNAAMTQGGLGGQQGDRHGMLADVLTDGLDGDPQKLVRLCDAFGGNDPQGMAQLNRMLAGFDGDKAEAGMHLKDTLDAFAARTGCTADEALGKLKDPMMDTMDKVSSSAGRAGGAEQAGQSVAYALANRPAPGVAQSGAAVLSAIKPGAAVDLLAVAGPADDVEAMRQSAENVALFDARAAATAAQDGPVGAAVEGIAELTTDLAKATEAATAQISGAPQADLTALELKIETVLDASTGEPDAALRAAAVAQVQRASKAIDAALTRRAAALVASAAGDPGEAVRAVASSLARASDDAAKNTLEAVAATTATAASLGLAVSAASAKEMAAAANTAIGDGEGADALKTAANDAARTATALAATATKSLEAARPPIDPIFLSSVADAATRAFQAARAAPDEAVATAALRAAALAAEAVAAAARETAAVLDAAAILKSTDGADALTAASSCDLAIAVSRRNGASSDIIDAQETARDAANASALTLTDAQAFRALDADVQTQKIDDALMRQATSNLGHLPGKDELGGAADTANAAAKTATEAAKLAQTTLHQAPSTGAGGKTYEELVKDTADKAQAAFEAAQLATDGTQRTAALDAAKAAAAEAAAGARRFAADQTTKATEDSRARQKANTAAVATDRDAFLVDSSAGNAQAALNAMNAATGAVAENAAALLSEWAVAAPPDPVGTATADVTKTSIAAQQPGAGVMAKVLQLEALCALDKALAVKAEAELTLALGAASLTVAPTGSPADFAAGAAAAEDAISTYRAAITAVMAYMERAETLKHVVTQALKDLGLIDVAKRTTDEAKNFTDLSNRPTAPGDMVDDAKSKRTGLSVLQVSLRNKLTALSTSAATGGPAVRDRIQVTAGMAQLAATERDLPPNNSQNQASLIRFAGTMLGNALPANVDETFDEIPGPPVVPAEDTASDLEHFFDRHMPETFGHLDTVKQANAAIGALIKAQYAGRATPPGKATKLETAFKMAKKTTFFPEGTTLEQMRTLARQATEVVKGMVAPDSLTNAVVATIPHGGTWARAWLSKYPVVIAGPPAGLTVQAGFNLTDDVGSGGKPMLRQMFPKAGAGLVTVNAIDMQVLATALGH